MENKTLKRRLFYLTGLLICIVPVMICVLSYFPLWASKSGAHVVSGFAALLCILALSPLFKVVKEALKSPASYVVWFGAFLLFFLLSKIAAEMTVISFVGFISNLVGAFFFKTADKYKDGKEDR